MKHNKEGILLNGMYFLWNNGYYNSGINDILKASQIPKGSFYNLFASKEDFCEEVLDLYGNMMNTSLEEFLADKRQLPLDRLKNFYMYQIEQSIDNTYIRGCLMCNLSLELAANSKIIRKTLSVHLSSNLSLLEKCMNEAENKGLLNDYFTPLEAAELVQNNWFGALLRTKALGKVEPLNQFIDLTFELLSSE
jgi:TetR/AcrR family transcriptional repressor of nem operon